MTTTSSRAREHPDVIRTRVRATHRIVLFLPTLIVCAGLAGACASTSSDTGAPAPTSPSIATTAATTTASQGGTTSTSAGQTGLTSCAQLQAAGADLSDTWQRYVNGEAALSAVLASAEGLAGAARNAAASSGSALRSQVEQLQTAAQSFVATLRSTPRPSRQEVQAAAQDLLTALENIKGPCASLRQ
jgi:hypothetical protein